MTGLTKTMYHVERFSPTQCPKCLHPFEKEGADWVQKFHKTSESGIHVDMNLIACVHCGNWTPRWDHEVYRLADRERTELLLSLGFVNLQEVRASARTGNSRIWRGLIYLLPFAKKEG